MVILSEFSDQSPKGTSPPDSLNRCNASVRIPPSQLFTNETVPLEVRMQCGEIGFDVVLWLGLVTSQGVGGGRR